MKQIYLTALSLAAFMVTAHAENTAPISNFTPAQIGEVKKLIGEYLDQNTGQVMAAFEKEMDKRQQEELAKLQKSVAQHKDKIYNNKKFPAMGNPKGTKSLVVFADPYCGYCRKLHEELPTVMKAEKNLKVILIDIPIMGEPSILAVKALLAANSQGKYEAMQNALLKAKGPLTQKKLMGKAKTAGLDVKKFEIAFNSKDTQAQIDQHMALAKGIGITATPLIIINENEVAPGYLPAEDLQKKLSVVVVPAK